MPATSLSLSFRKHSVQTQIYLLLRLKDTPIQIIHFVLFIENLVNKKDLRYKIVNDRNNK